MPAPSAAQGQTLTNQVTQASMVLYGTLKNAKDTSKEGDGSEGTTELVIDAIIKNNEVLGESKVITLPRYVPSDKGDWKYLVFCDIFKGKVDPYSGMAVKGESDMAAYLKGAVAVKDEKAEKRLKFFFDYLDNSETEISNDAFKEFGNADYKDYKDMAAGLPAEKLAKWLKDPKTPSYRFGTYASLLGHCGSKDKDKYVTLLKEILEDPERRNASGVDGVLAGFILLEPKKGWEYTKAILNDDKKEFLLRYAALRVARFFWEYRPDVINKKELTDAVTLLIAQGDISDLAIEDLRKWKAFDLTEKVLAIRDTKAYETPIVRRVLLRFALSGVGVNAAAKKYVDEQRKKDAQAVSDAEELLQLEQPKDK